MTTIAERVAAGVAWLDQNRPGWVQRINLDTLDLGDPCQCVLGQEFTVEARGDLATPYEIGRQALLRSTNDEAATLVSAGLGFHAMADIIGPATETDPEYVRLTTAWRDLIAQRRSLGDRTPDEIAAEKREADR